MESIEFIVWILAVLAAFVFHLRKSARNKARPSARVATPEELQPAQAAPVDMPAAPAMEVVDEAAYAHPEPVSTDWGRREPAPPRPAAAPAPRGASSPHVTRWRRGDRLELAHAVVAMTVLGPCRALAPYGQDEGAASAGARTRPAPPAAFRRP
ncbi:MAG: hypothetical protein V4609_12995 [Pseudomonadota bacterium]